MKIFDKKCLFKILGYDIYRSQKELESLKLLSKDCFWEMQREKRDSIFQYHHSHNSWYKKYFAFDSLSSCRHR